jgi:hypothetical protein
MQGTVQHSGQKVFKRIIIKKMHQNCCKTNDFEVLEKTPFTWEDFGFYPYPGAMFGLGSDNYTSPS